MGSILDVAEYINENARGIANEIVKYNVEKLEIELPKEVIDKSIKVTAEFMKFLAETINLNDDTVAEGLIEWSKKNGEQEASLMGKISSLIKPYADTRLEYIKRITKIAMNHGLTTEEVVRVNNRVNYMLDISLTETILSYEHHTDALMKKRQKEINDLSAPVVPIQDGIAVLPLIGSVDYDRAEHLLTHAVPKISQLGVQSMIIDFSGIITITPEVAGHVFDIYNVLRLLGINVIVTGIRPDLASEVVKGGIDFSSIKTYANVKQAIESMES